MCYTDTAREWGKKYFTCWSSSTKVASSLLQPFYLVSGTYNSWVVVLPGKTEAKEHPSPQPFPNPVQPGHPSYSTLGPHSPKSSLIVLMEGFLIVFNTSGQIQFHLYFDFLKRCMLRQYMCISPRLLILASVLCELHFCVWVWPGTPFSSAKVSWHFFLTSYYRVQQKILKY